ncbi:hypothetical protein FA13DRAFT_1708746 [Coprinellus micaceus]|uniref:Uncharacterized protein n=1 Tax=Coprinellus micaceus TaxID=71717 RepID=A0A4Y7TFL6_COPMI|nr:hypothetical protein FA13DRAFT_1708746 [Coprinellus micaceus]
MPSNAIEEALSVFWAWGICSKIANLKGLEFPHGTAHQLRPLALAKWWNGDSELKVDRPYHPVSTHSGGLGLILLVKDSERGALSVRRCLAGPGDQQTAPPDFVRPRWG